MVHPPGGRRPPCRDLPSTCAINDDPLQLLEECPKSKPVKLALWRDHGNEALGRVECASVCVPCAAAQSQARASMRFHTQQACEDAHTAQFEQTVVVYGACNQGVGEDIATAMAGALNSGVVPHILEATVEFKDCVVEGAAAAASFGAAKAKAPHKKAPGRATHKPVSAGGVRGVARPRGRQLSVVQQPVAPVSRLAALRRQAVRQRACSWAARASCRACRAPA